MCKLKNSNKVSGKWSKWVKPITIFGGEQEDDYLVDIFEGNWPPWRRSRRGLRGGQGPQKGGPFVRNCLNIANELYVQFDCFGYLSPIKRTSNEAAGTLSQEETFPSFYTGLVWLRWVAVDIYWYFYVLSKRYLQLQWLLIIVNMLVIISLDVSSRLDLLVFFLFY